MTAKYYNMPARQIKGSTASRIPLAYQIPWARGALRSTVRGTYNDSWNPMGMGTYDSGTKAKARHKFGDEELPNQMARSCLDYTGKTAETCGYSNLFISGCTSPATCNQVSGWCRCASSMCASSSTWQVTPWTPPDSKQTRPDHPKIFCPVLTALSVQRGRLATGRIRPRH
jgi:hypothetical protein